MDYCLDVIIRSNDIENAGLPEKTNEWNGEIISYIPSQYLTDSGIAFEEIEDHSFYENRYGIELSEEDVAMHLKSDIIRDLEYGINTCPEIPANNTLLDFLKRLTKLTMFYVVLVREDEDLKERHEIHSEEEMCKVLSDCMKWTDPKNVLFYKKLS